MHNKLENNMNALHQYQSINTQTSVVDVDRHQLIQLLFDGAVERINMAKARIQAKDFEGKNKLINRTIEIIAGLRGFLDFEKGGEISKNLSDLYVYCEHRLLQANIRNDIEALDEVANHIKTVREGWVGIRKEALEKGFI
jgi:flagellar protein FliS